MPRKNKTNGAQRRHAKLRIKRERGQLTGTLIKRTRVPRMSDPPTTEDWERVMTRAVRQVRRGRLLPEDGTKLAYMIKVVADLAMVRQQREEIVALRAQLAALTGAPELLRAQDDDAPTDPEPLLITKEN